ncbi:MAG TPA: DUF4292 domain-containing protein [Anaeromyxobacteraceae bacterium]|nr:DUF4292 domain-containing protein [Anaeromyxobacteraceae bacterium]
MIRRHASLPSARPARVAAPGRAGTAPGAALLALALAAACVPKAVPPPDLSLDPAQLLAQVRAGQARVRSVQGNARLDVRSSAFSGALGQYVAAERPDRLRLETLDFFGNPAAVMVADGKRFALYDARAKTVYVGRPTPANLSRLAPAPLAAADLVAVLCGDAPILEGSPVSAVPAPGAVVLRLEAGLRRQELTVGAGARVERSRLSGGDGATSPVAYELGFGERAEVDGVPLPGSVTLETPAPRTRVELTWKDVEVNRAVDPSLFVLAPPRGARVVDLGDGTVPPLAAPADRRE